MYYGVKQSMSVNEENFSKEYRDVLLSMRKTEKFLGTFDKIELFCICVPPFLIFAYLYFETVRTRLYAELKDINNHALFVLGILIIAGIVVLQYGSKISLQKKYCGTTYYAKLRAERDEYTIWAGVASLFMFVLKEVHNVSANSPKISILLIGFYILLIIAIYYRHLSQAIYIQETKNNLFASWYKKRHND